MEPLGKVDVVIANGATTVKFNDADVPPPDPPLNTASLFTPAVVYNDVGKTAVSDVEPTNVVTNGVVTPPVEVQLTTEDELKFVPVTVNTGDGVPVIT